MPSDPTLPHGVQRLRAPNPGPMTGTGTNSYVLTAGDDCLIIDPGPDLPDHLAAMTAAVAGRRVRGIIVTHAHLDHSQAAPRLGQMLVAPTLAFGGATSGRSPVMTRLANAGMTGGVEGLDTDFTPDLILTDGQSIPFGDQQVSVLHTPGHLGGHICVEWGDLLFSGDHVMAWSTSLVSPPDGDMAAYVAALKRLRALNRWSRFLPGHGEDSLAPADRLDTLITHREAREAAILAAIATGAATVDAVTRQVYTDTPNHLLPAARRNVLAHLVALWQADHLSDPAPLTETTPLTLRQKTP
jgi:glyoxylase-like metal-dependent hydrolase (beta-lactamase superfamily II)